MVTAVSSFGSFLWELGLASSKFRDMAINFALIDYQQLNARQKENYNFLKVSAVLADYGFVTMRLTTGRARTSSRSMSTA